MIGYDEISFFDKNIVVRQTLCKRSGDVIHQQLRCIGFGHETTLGSGSKPQKLRKPGPAPHKRTLTLLGGGGGGGGFVRTPRLGEWNTGCMLQSSGKCALTLHSCISVTDRVKIDELNTSIATGLLYVHTEFEAI